MKKIICLFIFLIQFMLSAWAQSTFVVKNIEIQGSQRTSAATIERYLTIKRGQKLTEAKSAQVIRALYQTGFFDRITLSRDGNTLIIHVTERPTIGQLKIAGNSVIPTDKLTAVMKSLDISEGRVYNPAILEKIKQSLLNQYYLLGRYNAHVDVTVSPLPRNRVCVIINISEGLVAKIRQITIIGNHAFDEKTLLCQLDLRTSGLLTIFTQADRYSEQRLDESLERLRAFYLDHGYIHFEVKSAQAEITPDRKAVYITIVISEGEPYCIKGFVIEGETGFPKEEFIKRVCLHPGERFSRQKIVDSEREITKYLGDQGYMFSTISLRPDVDDATHQVVVIFDVKPGKRTYVRHISFSENNRTNDCVLRREVEQMEGAPASVSKLEESKHRLSMLPFLKDVEMGVAPVPEVDDQVDVNYKVKEDNSAQMSFKVGYSQAYSIILAAGLNQKNFLGTGNTLGINLSRSRYEQFYGLEFTNPYYTEDGISRSFNLSISKVNPAAIRNFNNSYALNQYDAGVLYGIPIGQEVGVYNRIMFGLDYQNILILLNQSPNLISNQVKSFIQRHGRRFQELDIKLGYSRNSLDRAIFPTRGTLQTLYLDTYAPLSSSSLSFYTINYQGKWYVPLSDRFILLTRADLGYGNGFHGVQDFPFFKNFYAGGINSVRGYEDYSLGPRDSNDQSYGGNILVDGSIGLIFPNYISENLRTIAFVDGGNVYSSFNNRQFGCNVPRGFNQTCSTNSGPLRFSVGLEADVLSPFGPIAVSVAMPFRRPHDRMRVFQFAIGANF